jgi:preprotein translocase subunit SecG
MSFLIGLLTFVLVLICLALILLVLIQLPKKEAGVGVAFGGGATDALFGAGSGTVLTKATKYMAIAFFALALLVGMMQKHVHTENVDDFRTKADAAAQAPVAAPAAQPATPASAPATAPATAPLTAQPEAAPATNVPAGK